MFLPRLRQLGAFLGALSLAALLAATVASGDCGGSEEQASMQITTILGNGIITFEEGVGEKTYITIDNTGERDITVTQEHLNETYFKKLGSGCGTIGVGASEYKCSRQVECVKKGEVTFTVTADPSLVQSVTLKCD